MTIKEIQNKFRTFFLTNNEKKNEALLAKKFSFLVYPTILLFGFITYAVTYSSLNNKKIENEKNLEVFFSSKEFKNIKNSFFNNLKGPYLEFNYNIENNDSIGRILRKFRVIFLLWTL